MWSSFRSIRAKVLFDETSLTDVVVDTLARTDCTLLCHSIGHSYSHPTHTHTHTHMGMKNHFCQLSSWPSSGPSHSNYLSSFGVFSRCVNRKAASLFLRVLRLRWGGAGGHPAVASDWSLQSRCPESSALLALLNNLGCRYVILLDSALRCEEVTTEGWMWERERFSVPEIPTCSKGTWELCESGNPIYLCFPMKERQICEHVLLQLLSIQSDQFETCLLC